MSEGKELKIISDEVTVSDFTPEELVRVKEIARSIDISDSQAIIEYGVGAQSDIADFSDTVLNQVRSKDAGFAGEALNELMVSVKEIDVDSISGNSSNGIFKRFSRKVKKFIGRYNKLSFQIDSIVEKLETT
ncbi:MAG: toxic anion resistance protein, partial [Clostridiales bacterium]|nr:toxic anion resistance protein [Clostridiales bacterium]